MLKYLLLFLVCSAYAQDTLQTNIAIQEYRVNTWVSADSITLSPSAPCVPPAKWARLYIQNDTLKVAFSNGTGVIDSTARLFFEHIEAYSRRRCELINRLAYAMTVYWAAAVQAGSNLSHADSANVIFREYLETRPCVK